MADKPVPPDAASDDTVNTPAQPAATTPPIPPKRSPGHRGADVKDTVAEMTAKAHEISLEAGSKMAGAMKDVINAAAGITGFVVESARDLVQYMVRRGQMTQEEADKLIRQAEEAQVGRPAVAHSSKGAESELSAAPGGEAVVPEPTPVKPAPRPAPKPAPKPAPRAAAAKKGATEKPAEKAPAARSASAKPAMAKKTAAPPARKAPPPTASAAKKAPAKSAPKKATAKRK